MSNSVMDNSEIFNLHKKQLDEFENWIQSQPRLPQHIDKMLLIRFLKVYEFEIEKAQILLIHYLEVRKSHPEIFMKRDFLSEELQQAARTLRFVPIRKPSIKQQNITIFCLADPNPNAYDLVEIVRLMHATFDARFVMCEGRELLNGEITVVDMKGFSFRHMLKVIKNMSLMSAHLKYTQEAVPTKIIQNHFVNCSSFVHRLLAIMKPFMSQELIDTIKFHVNFETLYDFIPRELLPEEYGGTAGSLVDLHEEWQKTLLTKRDYVLNDDNWKLNE